MPAPKAPAAVVPPAAPVMLMLRLRAAAASLRDSLRLSAMFMICVESASRPREGPAWTGDAVAGDAVVEERGLSDAATVVAVELLGRWPVVMASSTAACSFSFPFDDELPSAPSPMSAPLPGSFFSGVAGLRRERRASVHEDSSCECRAFALPSPAGTGASRNVFANRNEPPERCFRSRMLSCLCL